MCYSKGAHLFTHRWLQLLTFGAFWIQFQILNVLPQGGSFVYSPLAAITHFWGILDSVSNFQCATPRGLIRLLTIDCNYSLLGRFGFIFKFSMCYPKGAHSFTITVEYLIVLDCLYIQLLHDSPEFLLWQHRTGVYEYKSILMVAVFGCFTMQLVLWPNAPIIGGWAVFFQL